MPDGVSIKIQWQMKFHEFQMKRKLKLQFQVGCDIIKRFKRLDEKGASG